MGIEVARAIIANIFKQFDQEEILLVVMRCKAKILIIASASLVVEVDVEEFARIECLSHSMGKIQACLLYTSRCV